MSYNMTIKNLGKKYVIKDHSSLKDQFYNENSFVHLLKNIDIFLMKYGLDKFIHTLMFETNGCVGCWFLVNGTSYYFRFTVNFQNTLLIDTDNIGGRNRWDRLDSVRKVNFSKKYIINKYLFKNEV